MGHPKLARAEQIGYLKPARNDSAGYQTPCDLIPPELAGRCPQYSFPVLDNLVTIKICPVFISSFSEQAAFLP